MENPFRKLSKKQRVAIDVPTDVLSTKELSRFAQDIDTVWMGDDEVGGGYELVKHLKELPEEDAALHVRSLLEPHLGLDINERLNAIGILVGELTPNHSTPSGVRGILAYGTPMVLMTKNESPEYHRPLEIARAIGEIVCKHSSDEVILKFVRAFDEQAAPGNNAHSKAIE